MVNGLIAEACKHVNTHSSPFYDLPPAKFKSAGPERLHHVSAVSRALHLPRGVLRQGTRQCHRPHLGNIDEASGTPFCFPPVSRGGFVCFSSASLSRCRPCEVSLRGAARGLQSNVYPCRSDGNHQAPVSSGESTTVARTSHIAIDSSRHRQYVLTTCCPRNLPC